MTAFKIPLAIVIGGFVLLILGIILRIINFSPNSVVAFLLLSGILAIIGGAVLTMALAGFFNKQ